MSVNLEAVAAEMAGALVATAFLSRLLLFVAEKWLQRSYALIIEANGLSWVLASWIADGSMAISSWIIYGVPQLLWMAIDVGLHVRRKRQLLIKELIST